MDVSSLASIGIGIQAASAQQNVAVEALKQAAQQEQEILQVLASSLGQVLDVQA